MTQRELLTNLLKRVSRSFYLTLRVLPRAIRPQVGLAYLLARATDTIADTEAVPLEGRLEALSRLRGRILGLSREPLDFAQFLAPSSPASAGGAERVLLERIEAVLALLEDCSPQDLARIRQTLEVITSGQELDLQRFGPARTGAEGSTAARGAPAGGDGASAVPSSLRIVALQEEAELDDYTYRVAGCVGEFWTQMCRAHLFPAAPLDDAFLIRNGVRFGKGLQLVNILRDLPRDLRLGRCYLPERQLTAAGLTPADLLDPGSEPRLRPLYHGWCQRAEEHLAAGWAYTNRLPWVCMRVRLACAWPILIGIRTLAALRACNPLDPARGLKISRGAVRAIIARSVLWYPLPSAWRSLFPVASQNGRPA